METEIASIALTCLIAALALMAEHYWPWGQRLSRPKAYTIGTLTIVLPLIGLYLFWDWWHPYPGTPFGWAIAALVSVVAIAGLTVYGLYALDGYRTLERRASIAEEINERAE